jgi:hypothetical protein
MCDVFLAFRNFAISCLDVPDVGSELSKVLLILGSGFPVGSKVSKIWFCESWNGGYLASKP